METNLVGLSGPIMISIDVTYRCNFRCKHCFNGSGTPLLGDELKDAELLSIARSVGVLQPNVVCFCGGEPLLRWEILCDACETIKSKSPYTQVNLVTNGSLVTETIANRLNRAGITTVQVSVDGPNSEIHDWFRNHPGSFDLAVNAIKILRKAGLNVVVASAPHKKHLLRLEETIDLCKRLGVSEIRKQQFAKVHGVFNRFQLFLKNAFDVDLLSAINFQKIAFLNFSLEGIIGAVAQAAIYITGGALILGHQLSIGGFVVIVVYFAYVTNAIKRIFSLNENYQLARAAHERLQEYLCMPLSTDGGLTTLEILSIEYKAVGFSFGGRFQLSNINLAFRKGTLYGLCGKNGSGKTTLMLLLLGIYPNYRGEILINGINQKQYNLKKLRSCVIHYTEQTPVFFDEPMVENFELFEGERRPFLQVKTYIQMLGLHNIVSLEDDALRFSEHYQYSAGELAKIAILRSLVLKKSVYIWDEPDTALDEAAKQALIKILKELSNEAIVVIITHNSDLLNACETIYHL